MKTNVPVDSTSSAPPEPARLLLEPAKVRSGMLDGAWWPRSRDIEPELTALVVAVTAQLGTVFRVGVNHSTWDSRVREIGSHHAAGDSRPSRIVVDGVVVKIGWFGPSDPHAIAITGSFPYRLDLLVVPPDTDAASAEAAMRTASDSTSTARASAVLTAHGIDADLPGRHPSPGRAARTAPLSVVGAPTRPATNGHQLVTPLRSGIGGQGS